MAKKKSLKNGEVTGNTPQAESPPKNSMRSGKISVAAIYVLLILSSLAVGFFVGRKSVKIPQKDLYSWNNRGIVEMKPGPWGKLAYLPITIAPPEELLNVRGVEETPVRWVFKNYSRDGLVNLLNSLDVPGALRDQLLGPQSLGVSKDGLLMQPSRDAVAKLSSSAREGLYKALGTAQENEKYKWEYKTEEFDTLEGLGISKETVSNLKNLSSPYGSYQVCYALSYVMATIPTYAEKVNLVKALSRQQTMLVKLRITPKSDIDGLIRYWGKSLWATDVRALLESTKKLPVGGVIDVIELLPPFPTSLLYSFPKPQNILNGPIVNKNCSWTAFNFFRDTPDPKFSDPNYVLEKLKTEYYPVHSDPQYGDVLVFLTPDGFLIHTAVYVADDIAYSKNGDNPWHPWMFAKISDLEESTAYGVPPGEKLSVSYYRNKYY